MLGLAMAQFMATEAVFRNNDAIGVGSGRGVNNVLKNLRFFPPLRMTGVSLFSLTGSVYSRPSESKVWYDADRHVVDFAEHFVTAPSQYLIGHPLAFEKRDLSSAIDRTWLKFLENRRPSTRVPPMTHLLVGVGALRDTHRFHIEAIAKDSDREPFLRPIHKLLVDLVNMCDSAVKNPERPYRPCADVSNFLYMSRRR
jgi:DNA-binding transcriptional regulator LsrR (DeoR family)